MTTSPAKRTPMTLILSGKPSPSLLFIFILALACRCMCALLSSKMPKPGNTSDVIKQEKSSSKAKKMGSEIDEIFGGKKRKRLEEGNKADSNKQKPDKVFAANNESHDKIKIGKNRKSNSFEENSSANRSCRMRKKTADGLTVYTEEELGFGKADAGGTNLCPFDCDCCF